MSFWTTAAPLIGMGLGAFGGPVGMAAGGAIGGAVAGTMREKEEKAREAASLNARAAGIQASYGRKDGKGSIVDARMASGNSYGLEGAVGGGMQGFSLGNSIAGAQAAQPSYVDKNFSMGAPAAPAGGGYNLGADYGPGYNAAPAAPAGGGYNLGVNGIDYSAMKAQSPASRYSLYGNK